MLVISSVETIVVGKVDIIVIGTSDTIFVGCSSVCVTWRVLAASVDTIVMRLSETKVVS